MSKSPVLRISHVLLLVALLLLGWLGHHAWRSAPEDAAAAADATGRSGIAASPPRVVTERASAPDPTRSSRPPVEVATLPALQQVGLLDAHARAGDVGAACRLGTVLWECVMHRRRPRPGYEPADRISALPPDVQERMAAATARMIERWERREEHCADVSVAEHRAPALRYLLAAGLRGSDVARHQFVAANLTTSDLIEDPELARLYAVHAPALFQQMWSEGDPRAIEVLHRAASAISVDRRHPAWHAIPDHLRNRGIARVLWELRIDRGVWAERPGMRLDRGSDEQVDPQDAAEAHRLWNEHFERSALTSKLRAEGATAGHVPSFTPERCDEPTTPHP